jgi:hypothetical protein
MDLEARLTYLVAVAVPVWLLVEQLVSRRRSRDGEAVQPDAREPRVTSEAEAGRVAPRADSASGKLRRRAA